MRICLRYSKSALVNKKEDAMQDKHKGLIRRVGFVCGVALASIVLGGCGLYPLVNHDSQSRLVPLASGNLYTNSYYNSDLNWAARMNLVGQCTWYAYGRIQETGMVTADVLNTAVNRFGGNGVFLNNANTWDDDAGSSGANSTAAGLVVGSNPRAGALAIWDSVRNGQQDNHVAYVESVQPGGSILVTESNYKPKVNGDIVVNNNTDNSKVRLRSGPSTSKPILWEMPQLTVMKVISGPTSAENYTWYQLQGNGYTGWAARICSSAAVCNYTGISLQPSSPIMGANNPPSKYIYFKPQLLTNGRFISSRPQLQTFSMTGSRYTPNGQVRRVIKYPNGAQKETSSITADSGGNITSGWRWTPQCVDTTGDYKVWTIDVSSGLQSNTITERVTKGC